MMLPYFIGREYCKLSSEYEMPLITTIILWIPVIPNVNVYPIIISIRQTDHLLSSAINL